MKAQSKLGRFVRSVSPTAWPFILACCLVLLGASLPYASLLLYIGLFVMGIYGIIAILWVLFQANRW